MSESSNRNRRRRNRNRGPRPNRDQRDTRPTTGPSGLQKFLNVISFGLLGGGKKTSPKPQARPAAIESAPRPQREPRPRREAAVNPAEITTERLYVGNLSYDATESDLFELFNGVGNVRNAEVVVNSRTQRSKGFAFVTMGGIDEARRAVQELNGKDFMGRPLQLSGAKPNTRGGGDSPSTEESQPEEKAAA